MRHLLISLLFFLIASKELHAQLYEVGFHLAFVQSDLKPEQGYLTDKIFVREGRSKSGFAFGMQFSVGQPKSQPRPGLDPKFWGVLEGSLARTGGNYSTAVETNGNTNLYDLDFTFYRLDFTPKFVVGSKKMRLLLGPAVSSIFYGGYITAQSDVTRSATADYSRIVFGYEVGFGMAFGRTQVSLRNLRFVTDYGTAYRGVAMPIKNNDIRVFLAFTIKEKHKGAYWNSIDWDK